MKTKLFNVELILFLIATFIIFSGKLPGQVTFSPATNFSSGSQPFCAVTSDFNSDGKQDFAVTNSGAANIYVFINTTSFGSSTPSFSSPFIFSTGGGPAGIIARDFNRDGKTDIAVANTNSGSFSVFINTTTIGSSTPAFASHVDFATESTPIGILSEDFNNDGLTDIGVSNYGANCISVFLNTTIINSAIPSFSAKSNLVSGNNPLHITSGDMNNDGKQDIAVSNEASNSFSVFLNSTSPGASSPTFSAKNDFSTGVGSYGISLGDINGDGKLDVAVTTGNSVKTFISTTVPGSASVSFSSAANYVVTAAPISIILKDINEDNKPDIIIGNGSSNYISAFLDTTVAGSLTPSFCDKINLTTGNIPRSIALADFNGDGKVDIVTANNSSNNVSVLLNTMSLGTSTQSFSSRVDFSSGNYSPQIYSTDINSDGIPDILLPNANTNSFSIFLNITTAANNTPAFLPKIEIVSGNSMNNLSTGDFNLDGKQDIVTACNNASIISVFINTTIPGSSTVGFSSRMDLVTVSTPMSVVAADFNLDGKPDLVATNNGSSSISVFINTTTPGAGTASFSSKTDITTSGYWETKVGDFNLDGKPDIIGVSSGNVVTVLINNTSPGASSPSFSSVYNYVITGYIYSVEVIDINGDGKSDFVCANAGTNSACAYINMTSPGDANPIFSVRTDFTVGTAPTSISKADFNGDGKTDLVLANYIGNTVSVLLNTTVPGATTSSFSSKTDYLTPVGPNGVCTNDLNQDGKTDFIVTNYLANSISVFLSNVDLPLPIELSTFTAIVNSNSVTLNWSTVSEENNSGFDIERKLLTENNWKKIGNVAGNGNSNEEKNYSYTENGLAAGKYNYRLKQIDFNGNFDYHNLTSEVIIGMPSKFELSQNYPNPFNPVSVIGYQLPVSGFVSLKVFDISGREVSQLVNEVKEAGYYTVNFNAAWLSSGTYFYKLSSDKFSAVKKMVVVK